MNLLEETILAINDYNKTIESIQYVRAEHGWFTWEEFIALANVDYDCGYGSQKVAMDLVIVGDNWYMDRGEYDGQEWWEFHTPPQRPTEQIHPSRLVCPESQTGWCRLKQFE